MGVPGPKDSLEPRSRDDNRVVKRRRRVRLETGRNSGSASVKAKPTMVRRLFVFVPVAEIENVDIGSAIVSMDVDALPGDLITVDFESNRDGYSNLTRFRERLLHAGGRHVERYPTRARAQVVRSALINVGYADYDDGRLVTFRVTDREALKAWIGDEIDHL